MGLFGSESKTKATSAQQSAGAQTQVGSAATINVSGGKVGSKISIVETDQGAIASALNFAENIAARDMQLSQSQVDSAERTAKHLIASGSDFSRLGDNFGRNLAGKGDLFGRYTIDAAREVSGQMLNQTQAQSVLFSDALGGLVEGFQEFTNRENNPGERVNLYLIIAAAGVAGVFLLRGKI